MLPKLERMTETYKNKLPLGAAQSRMSANHKYDKIDALLEKDVPRNMNKSKNDDFIQLKRQFDKKTLVKKDDTFKRILENVPSKVTHAVQTALRDTSEDAQKRKEECNKFYHRQQIRDKRVKNAIINTQSKLIKEEHARTQKKLVVKMKTKYNDEEIDARRAAKRDIFDEIVSHYEGTTAKDGEITNYYDAYPFSNKPATFVYQVQHEKMVKLAEQCSIGQITYDHELNEYLNYRLRFLNPIDLSKCKSTTEQFMHKYHAVYKNLIRECEYEVGYGIRKIDPDFHVFGDIEGMEFTVVLNKDNMSILEHMIIFEFGHMPNWIFRPIANLVFKNNSEPHNWIQTNCYKFWYINHFCQEYEQFGLNGYLEPKIPEATKTQLIEEFKIHYPITSFVGVLEYLFFYVTAMKHSDLLGKISITWMMMRYFTSSVSIVEAISGAIALDGPFEYVDTLLKSSVKTLDATIDYILSLFSYEGTTLNPSLITEAPLMKDCACLLVELVSTGLMTQSGLWTKDFNQWLRLCVFPMVATGNNILILANNIFIQLLEGGKMFLKSHDYRDLIYSHDMKECYVKLNDLRIRVGKAHEIAFSPEEKQVLLQDLEDLRKQLSGIMAHPSSDDRKVGLVRTVLKDTNDLISAMKVLMKVGSIRKAPAVVQIVGPPGCGKSEIYNELLAMMLPITGVMKHDPSQIAVINESDPFDTTILNTTVALVIDDMGAIRTSVIKNQPVVTKIISWVNAVATPAYKAQLEDKGTVYPNPHVIVITSNTLEMDIAEVMRTPDATLRRFNIVVQVVVPTQFSIKTDNDDKLDKSKLGEGSIARQMYYLVGERKITSAGKYEVVATTHYTTVDGRVCPLIFEKNNGKDVLTFAQMMLAVNSITRKLWNEATKYQQIIDDIKSKQRCVCGMPIDVGVCTCAAQLTILPADFVQPIISDKDIKEDMIKQQPYKTITIAKYHGTTMPGWLVIGSGAIVSMYFIGKNVFMNYEQDITKNIELVNKGTKLLKNYVNAEETVNNFTNLVKSTIDIMDRNRKKVLAICLLFAGALSITGFIRNVAKSKNFEGNVWTNYNGVMRDIKLPAEDNQYPYEQVTSDQRQLYVRTDNGLEPSLRNTTPVSLYTKIRNSIFNIHINGNKGNGFFISSVYFVCNLHIFPPDFIDGKISTVSVTLSNIGTLTSPIMVSRDCVYFEDGHDIAYIFIEVVRKHPDLSVYCAKKKDEGVIALPEVEILSIMPKDNILEIVKNNLYDGSAHTDVVGVEGRLFSVDGFKFRGAMIKGTSGSPVFYKTANTCVIIGIQSGSDSNTSVVQKFLDFNKVINYFNRKPAYRILEPNVSQFIGTSISNKPSPYSIVYHLLGSSMSYGGTLVDYTGIRNKTNFRKTVLWEKLTEDGKFTYKGRRIHEEEYVIPVLSPFTISDADKKIWISSKYTGLAQACRPTVVEPSIPMLTLCFEDYIAPILELKLPEVKGPVTLYDVVNGAPGVKSINKNAAMGFGYRGIVKDHLVHLGGDKYEFNPSIKHDIDVLEQQIFNFDAPYQIVKANVKDEIVKESKISTLRIFMSFPLPFTVLCKKYLTPLFNIILQYPDLFEVALGINCLGKSWTKLVERMKQRPHIIDGDYKKFDKHQARRIILFIKWLFMALAKLINYPEYCVRMSMNLIEMMVYYVVECGGDLIELFRSMASGCLLTIFINCFVNSMYFRLAWFALMAEMGNCVDCPRFRDMNTLYTFGDDALNSTSEDRFTLPYISRHLAMYGVTLTAASKSDIMPTFSNWDEVKFLKRGFKPVQLKDGYLYYLCPLEEVSIFKMLAFTDVEEFNIPMVLATNLVDAHKQYWFHGKEVFEDRKKFLKELADFARVSNSIGDEESNKTLKWSSYEQLEDAYLDGSIQIQFV